MVQNSARYGRQTGVAVALGLAVGIAIHATLSISGISLLVHRDPTLYNVVQIAGGAYLFWLGTGALKSALRSPDSGVTKTAAQLSTHREAFIKGLTTNLFNPKALVFFVSLLSTLIPATMSGTGRVSAIFLLFAMGFFWFAMLASVLTTRAIQQRLQRITRAIDALTALVFCTAGGSILWFAVSSCNRAAHPYAFLTSLR